MLPNGGSSVVLGAHRGIAGVYHHHERDIGGPSSDDDDDEGMRRRVLSQENTLALRRMLSTKDETKQHLARH